MLKVTFIRCVTSAMSLLHSDIAQPTLYVASSFCRSPEDMRSSQLPLSPSTTPTQTTRLVWDVRSSHLVVEVFGSLYLELYICPETVCVGVLVANDPGSCIEV